MNTENANVPTPTENGQQPKAVAKKPTLFTRQNAPFLGLGGILALVSLIMLFSPSFQWLDQREQTKLEIDTAERNIEEIREEWSTVEEERDSLIVERDAKIKVIEQEYADKIAIKEGRMLILSSCVDALQEKINSAYESLVNDQNVSPDIIGLELPEVEKAFR